MINAAKTNDNRASDAADLQSGKSTPGTIDTPDAKNRQHYTISDLSEDFGVTARALRFYEDEGLIAPSRKGTARVYSKRDRARLAWIMRAKNVGFSLSEIREMLDLYDLGDGRRKQRKVTIARCKERIAQLNRQKEDIDSALAELTGFVELVENLSEKELAARSSSWKIEK